MEEQTTIPQELVVLVKDLNIVFSIEFEKQGRGECKIPICDKERLRVMWSYEDEMNEEEDKKAKEREEREKAKKAEERKKWNIWTTSLMSVPSKYKEDKETVRCECCDSCAKCLCFLHPMAIVNFVLGPIFKLVTKYGHLCGCFIACRDMQEDPDESEEQEEQPNEEMKDQREEKETKEGEGELEEGKKGNWKKGFIKPCDLVVIDVAARFLIEDEEEKKAMK